MFQMNLSFISYPGSLKEVPQWEAGIKIFMYVLVIITALIGNLLIILIVWRNKHMRTTTNYYIVNLAVSDLMVTCSCSWVQLVDDLTNGWVLGAFFCKFNSFAQVCSLVSSVMTLCLIACDRFFGIVFAMKAHMTERRASTLIVFTWVIAISVSLPFFFFREEKQREWADYVERWCDDTFPHIVETHVVGNVTYTTSSNPSKVGYLTFISVVLFFVPIVVMSIAYALIIWKLWSNRLPGERIESEVSVQDRLKKKVVMMLMVLLSVFALCWMPLQVSVLYETHRPQQHTKLADWYDDFKYFAAFMAYSNSALNPIIYAGFNQNFKRGFKNLLRCKRFDKKYSAVSLRRDSSYRSSTVVTKI